MVMRDSPQGNPRNGPVHNGWAADQVARDQLEAFRTVYVPYCPFVALDPTLTLDTVRKDLPVTLFVITAVMGSSHSANQIPLQEELRRRLFTAVIIDGGASLDLLRALLIYMTWYQYFYNQRGKGEVFLALQLCLNVAHNLGLEKNTTSALETYTDTSPGASRNQLENRGSLDEKRLLLGVYWMSVR